MRDLLHVFYILNHFTLQQLGVRGRAPLIQTSEASTPPACSKHGCWRPVGFRLGMKVYRNIPKSETLPPHPQRVNLNCSTCTNQIVRKGYKTWNSEEPCSESKAWTSATRGLGTAIYLPRPRETSQD